MSLPAFVLAFVLAFLLGRLGSVLLYQGAWNHGLDRRFHPLGALATFLRRPWPWLLHLPVMALSVRLDWSGLPAERIFAGAAAGALALGAVGRWGAADLGRFFLIDRGLVVLLSIGVWLSPACLYPLLLACCCLQYSVSGWPLNPGYSNLLGFEFMRSSLCMLLAALLVQAGLGLLAPPDLDLARHPSQALALVLCGQAAGYVSQALAKCALGKHWHSWILENRLQCLAVNSWLRGWGAAWISKEGILRMARWISRVRVPLCGAAWLIEIGWLLVLADPRLAIVILAATVAFHLAVWLLTGLAGYHYALSHGVMIGLIVSMPAVPRALNPGQALVGAGCILASTVWVLLLRRHLFRAYVRGGTPGRWARLLDPADHLMAWWDGPYMRMYSFSVKTASGRRYRFPVTRFSPYDTFLTDIHTHLMILGRDWDLDPRLAADRSRIRTGVWGLTVTREERDRAYALMDHPQADLSILNPSGNAVPQARADAGLAAFFQGLNRHRRHWWFRLILRWPHFPGEDWVPDISPLASERLPAYRGNEPVTEVTVQVVKTLYRRNRIPRKGGRSGEASRGEEIMRVERAMRGEEIVRVEETVIARFPIGPAALEPATGRDSDGTPARALAAEAR